MPGDENQQWHTWMDVKCACLHIKVFLFCNDYLNSIYGSNIQVIQKNNRIPEKWVMLEEMLDVSHIDSEMCKIALLLGPTTVVA